VEIHAVGGELFCGDRQTDGHNDGIRSFSLFFLIGQNITFGHWRYLCFSYSSHGEHQLFPPNNFWRHLIGL